MTLALALLVGCTVPFSTSVGSDVEMGLQIDQNCTGSDTVTDDTSTTTYTLAIDGDDCVLDVTWAGQLVSQADLDAEVEDAFEGRPIDRDNVTVTGATLTLERIELVDGSGNPAAITTYPAWAIDLQVAGEALYSGSGTDVSTILDAPVELALTAGQLTALNAAVQGEGSFDGNGTASLRIPVAELPSTPTDMAVNVSADMALDAEIGL